MVTKPAKEYTDSQGRRKVKGNMDIELTVDAMELAPRVDHIVLFSGDGDFRPLVESLQRQGVRVSVVSTIRSQPPMIADELRRQADNFIELDELRDVIGRPPREPRPDRRARRSVDRGEVAPRGAAHAALRPPFGCRPSGMDARAGSTYLFARLTPEARMTKAALTLYLAAPRGFCAGVDRAIKIVEMALSKWGAPVYVRHEIVHNRYVVDGLARQGGGLRQGTGRCAAGSPGHLFGPWRAQGGARRSGRGVKCCSSMRPARWSARSTSRPNATMKTGLQMVMIGHAGHPETIGTMGQLPPGDVLLVETVADVARLAVRDPDRLAFITQTTLSVDDTAEIVAALQATVSRDRRARTRKTSAMPPPTVRRRSRQIAPKIDALLVIGAPNSSNSRRLVEVGRAAGCGYAQLIQRAADIDWRALDGDHGRRRDGRAPVRPRFW